MKLRRYVLHIPLENKSKGCHDGSGKGMTVDNKDVVAHTTVEGNDGDDVHSSVAELEGDDCDVWVCTLKEMANAF